MDVLILQQFGGECAFGISPPGNYPHIPVMSTAPRRFRGIPVFSTQATAVVSVSMVLLILGIVTLMGIAARQLGGEVRSSVGYVAVVSDSADEAALRSLRSLIESAPSTASATFAPADSVLARWEAMQPADTASADIVELLGINPFSAEWEVRVGERWASSDSLAAVTAVVRVHPAVAEVVVHQEMIDAINSTVDTLTLALLIVAAALLLISVALINNTVRLSVYARRFTIHTMKLVGATAGYIRRPFVISNIIGGIIAALLAYALLAMLLYYCRAIDPVVTGYITPGGLAVTGAGMLVAGVAISTLSACFAANKYIRASYDDMFGR